MLLIIILLLSLLYYTKSKGKSSFCQCWWVTLTVTKWYWSRETEQWFHFMWRLFFSTGCCCNRLGPFHLLLKQQTYPVNPMTVLYWFVLLTLFTIYLLYTCLTSCYRLTQSPTQVNPAETQEQVYSSLLHGQSSTPSCLLLLLHLF